MVPPRPALTSPRVSAGLFGVVLGIAGLGGAWRLAARAWGLFPAVGECLFGLAALIWAVLLGLYALKWIFDRRLAQAEAAHPVSGCFISLVGVTTMLISLGALPYSRALAEPLFWTGASFTFLFALWRIGVLWQGGREAAAVTPVLYLPAVAGGYVTAIAATAFGYPGLARCAFGAALLTWIAIESVLLQRLYHLPAMAPSLRPSLGIQMAPPAVGLSAYLSLNGGAPDLPAQMLLGYGLFQAALLVRLLPWILRQPFNASYWAFSFGLAALAASLIRMDEAGQGGLAAWLAPPVFVLVNAVILWIGALSLRSGLRGGFSPPSGPRPAASSSDQVYAALVPGRLNE
ncbi:dicarboxylate transporter/tellurite-resistance protein TehA [Acidocella sp.]|uniref:dicarboxylate transporter/tellurite-resistance protein TehA n=1 Tax=Acidocella sp. TaxID=50710 RepID=UPI002601A43A|nr:dicarboxylate transporter/tellurite-resistance protein TehA [Acidocella sp.]